MYIVFTVLNIELQARNKLGKHAVPELGPWLSYKPFNGSILVYCLTSSWFIFNDKIVATYYFSLYCKHCVNKHSCFIFFFFHYRVLRPTITVAFCSVGHRQKSCSCVYFFSPLSHCLKLVLKMLCNQDWSWTLYSPAPTTQVPRFAGMQHTAQLWF